MPRIRHVSHTISFLGRTKHHESQQHQGTTTLCVQLPPLFTIVPAIDPRNTFSTTPTPALLTLNHDSPNSHPFPRLARPRRQIRRRKHGLVFLPREAPHSPRYRHRHFPLRHLRLRYPHPPLRLGRNTLSRLRGPRNCRPRHARRVLCDETQSWRPSRCGRTSILMFTSRVRRMLVWTGELLSQGQCGNV